MSHNAYGIDYWLQHYPGCRAYVLQAPGGRSFTWKPSQPKPEGRYYLLTTWEQK